jgi:hypothetical protein
MPSVPSSAEADAQPCTWRTMVIKVAVVVQSTRRVVVKLAGN